MFPFLVDRIMSSDIFIKLDSPVKILANVIFWQHSFRKEVFCFKIKKTDKSLKLTIKGKRDQLTIDNFENAAVLFVNLTLFNKTAVYCLFHNNINIIIKIDKVSLKLLFQWQ